MPLLNEDDDDIQDDDECEHCECWSDGGDCCDCGMENSDWDGDPDEEGDSTPFIVPPCDDDGSEEMKD